jgi:DNA polymerase V
MRTIPVGEVWGIGSRSAAMLNSVDIQTVAQLRDMEPRAARRMLSVVGERIVHELRGLACLPLDYVSQPQKGLAVTRSFGNPVTEWEDMRAAVASYATRAGEKLRSAGLVAAHLQVFAHTSTFRGDRAYSGSSSCEMRPQTSDTMVLIAHAAFLAARIWRDGYRFAKAGILLGGLVPLDRVQPCLLESRDRERSARLMHAMGTINRQMGRGMVVPASTRTTRGRQMKQDSRSSRYTTNLAEIPVVKT